ncbi:CPBP family intramembrane glutamic endopeptidase [Nocardia sp. NPDC005366]|uniref:CPBP family intramembrane glutamic endopeptidase n=1 Tax=Nocardia sp. NPDC005366 TaxID=3156878 RepID=UPI0033B7E1AB
MSITKVIAAVAIPLLWNNTLLPHLRLDQRGRTVAHAAFATGYAVMLGGHPNWGSPRGVRYGLASTAAVSAGYAVALAIPAIRDRLAEFGERGRIVEAAFGDGPVVDGPVVDDVAADDVAADDVAVGGAVIDPAERVVVHIPIGTVYTEELIFRATLDPLLDSALGPRVGTVAAAATFGLWHIHPARVAGDSVIATVAATTLGGLVFATLGRRADSVTAPALLHFALNAGGVVAPLLAERRRPAG